MPTVLGGSGGLIAIRRNPPSWAEPAFVEMAFEYVKKLK